MEVARNVIDWDSYFINIAEEVATRSKDPSTQV
jgi:deoxycytidylate deaminase